MERLTPNHAAYKRWLADRAKRRQAIHKLYDSGWTQSAIALKFGVSRQRVNAILRKK